jgi:hypothetical protein
MSNAPFKPVAEVQGRHTGPDWYERALAENRAVIEVPDKQGVKQVGICDLPHSCYENVYRCRSNRVFLRYTHTSTL